MGEWDFTCGQGEGAWAAWVWTPVLAAGLLLPSVVVIQAAMRMRQTQADLGPNQHLPSLVLSPLLREEEGIFRKTATSPSPSTAIS